MSEPITLDALRAAAKAMPPKPPHKACFQMLQEVFDSANYERARAEFWHLYAQWLDQWADAPGDWDLETGSLAQLRNARVIRDEVEART